MYFPDSIFNLILEFKSQIIKAEQITLSKRILSFYEDQNLLNGENYNEWRTNLKSSIEKALKYDYCKEVLCYDKEFQIAYDEHGNDNRNFNLFKQMDWLDSMITSIWYNSHMYIFLDAVIFTYVLVGFINFIDLYIQCDASI